ncbi:MAG: YitT family protein [Muribaculaceae bacterium]|nr:YitT family protein [Muribaculaceae bacterium]
MVKKLTTKQILSNAKDYIMIFLGLAAYAFGFTAFVLPEKVVTGGVTGLATLFHFGFGWNVAISYYAINIILLAIAFKTVGRTFVVRTIIAATIVTFLMGFMIPLFPKPLVNGEPFMNMIIGAIFCGMGIGTIYVHNGSSAGTDIIAAMVTKHSNISFGRMLLYIDVVIISSSYLIFQDLEKIIFGLVFMVLCTYTVDMVINSNRKAVQFLIFSHKWEEIANAITNDAHRGCTVLEGTGWYSKQNVKIVLVLCRRFESVRINRIIKAVDRNAFISIATVGGVYGNGFDEMKVKLHNYHPTTTPHQANDTATIADTTPATAPATDTTPAAPAEE